MRYKLVCIDMDGTLLNSKHKITETTKETLRKTHEKGVHIVISTGRMYTDGEYFSNLIGVKSPVIASNGAVIKEKDRDEVIYKSILSESLTKKLLSISAKHKVPLMFFTPKTLYSENILYSIFSHFLKLRKYVSSDMKINTIFSKEKWDKILTKEKENIVKCEFYNRNEEKLRKIRDELKNIKDIEVVSSSKYNIEITCKGVSKGRAVEILAGYYNLRKEQVITIGDSENDLSMIEYAGLGIAMGNAIDRVKEKANFITDSNDNEGVAKAINNFILGRTLD